MTGKPAARPKRAPTPEKLYQRTLVDALKALGYEVSHTFPLRTESGWRTGNTAKGWPDLVCLRGPWIVAIEVKAEGGRLRPEQGPWLERFARIPGGRAWVLDPTDDLDVVKAWLNTPAAAPRRHGF